MSLRILMLAVLLLALTSACASAPSVSTEALSLAPGQAPVSMVPEAAHRSWAPDPVLRPHSTDVESIREYVGGARTVAATGPTAETIAKGFAGIRRSTDQCLTRFLKRNDRPPASKVNIQVVIEASGAVSAVRMDGKVSRTVFGTCMMSHTDRWRFAPWKGAPVKVSRVFVLE